MHLCHPVQVLWGGPRWRKSSQDWREVPESGRFLTSLGRRLVLQEGLDNAVSWGLTRGAFSTYSGPEPQMIMSPELPRRNTRSTMRPNTWETFSAVCTFSEETPTYQLYQLHDEVSRREVANLESHCCWLFLFCLCLIVTLSTLSQQWSVLLTRDTKPCGHRARKIRKLFTTLTWRCD